MFFLFAISFVIIHIYFLFNIDRPPANSSNGVVYITADELVLCYGILTHEKPTATVQLIEALTPLPRENDDKDKGPRAIFLIHVDGKEASDDTYAYLREYAERRRPRDVHVLSQRVRVNWGGYTMVRSK